jgi:sugar phosphate isomerase/epimerase
MRRLSLAPLTVPDLAPPEFVVCAAQAGYSQVALRLIQGNPLREMADSLIHNQQLLRKTRACLRDESVSVSEIEVLVIDAATRIDACEAMLATAAELGARHLVVSISDTDFARVSANLAELCERAAAFNLIVNIECVPYTAVRTLNQAYALTHAVTSDNAAVLIDAIHFDRAGQCADDIALFPSALFKYVQLCDLPAARPHELEDIIRQSRYERLYPGEGGIDITGILRALPADLPISIEVPNIARIEQIGAVEHARRAREQTVALLRSVGEL